MKTLGESGSRESSYFGLGKTRKKVIETFSPGVHALYQAKIKMYINGN